MVCTMVPRCAWAPAYMCLYSSSARSGAARWPLIQWCRLLQPPLARIPSPSLNVTIVRPTLCKAVLNVKTPHVAQGPLRAAVRADGPAARHGRIRAGAAAAAGAPVPPRAPRAPAGRRARAARAARVPPAGRARGRRVRGGPAQRLAGRWVLLQQEGCRVMRRRSCLQPCPDGRPCTFTPLTGTQQPCRRCAIIPCIVVSNIAEADVTTVP